MASFSLPPISELFKDPLQGDVDEAATSHKSLGSKCEITFCDARLNAKGERVYLHAGTKRAFDTPSDPEKRESALVHTKYYDEQGWVQYTESQVHSPYLRKALTEVIGLDYPDATTTSDRMKIQNLSRCLFFHRDELRNYGKTLDDVNAAHHLNLALKHMYTELSHSMQVYKDSIQYPYESGQGEPRIDFANLWMAFRPNDLVVQTWRGRKRLYRVTKTTDTNPGLRHRVGAIVPFTTCFEITLHYLDCDGDCVGYDSTSFSWYKRDCPGYTRLRDLPLCPLRYLPLSEPQSIKESAQARGTKFLELCKGVRHFEYEGLANVVVGSGDDIDLRLKEINGRVMVDCYQNSFEWPGEYIDLMRTEPKYNIAADEHLRLSDEELITLTGINRIFSQHQAMGSFQH